MRFIIAAFAKFCFQCNSLPIRISETEAIVSDPDKLTTWNSLNGVCGVINGHMQKYVLGRGGEKCVGVWPGWSAG